MATGSVWLHLKVGVRSKARWVILVRLEKAVNPVPGRLDFILSPFVVY